MYYYTCNAVLTRILQKFTGLDQFDWASMQMHKFYWTQLFRLGINANAQILIGPCDYCGSFYAHSADTMKHHVNECAGSTTGNDDNDD